MTQFNAAVEVAGAHDMAERRDRLLDARVAAHADGEAFNRYLDRMKPPPKAG